MLNSVFSKEAKQKREIQDNARKIIGHLAVTLGERTLRKYRNLGESERFIINRFSQHVYPVLEEEYYVNDSRVANIIAEIPGYERPERIIVIGAHYDTIEDTPGADDNASGIAALLEIYRLMAPLRCRRTIRFVAFTLEEPPFFQGEHMGSMVNAKKARERNDPIELMVCLEMLGFAGKKYKQNVPFRNMGGNLPERGDFLAVVSLPTSAGYTYAWKKIYNRNSKQPIVDIIGPSSIPGITHSDHYSFNRYGYPAIMLTDTAFYRNTNYHTESDTVDTINFSFLAEHIYRTFQTLREMADQDEILGEKTVQ
ncbi:MAG TPA: M28 family peptidase [Spirochaetes bacterium]|nr:M28 family peptidase [Spirochaetota bacterium]